MTRTQILCFALYADFVCWGALGYFTLHYLGVFQ